MQTPTRSLSFGFFLLTLATLLHEILLTRIFSVTMWYHFAFMAISLAMFGMTAGALVVHFLPRPADPDAVRTQAGLAALAFAVTTVVSFLMHLVIPFVVHVSLTGVLSIAITVLFITLPFVASGVCVALVLTRFPGHVARLYAVDLAGAACGCLMLAPVLGLADGPLAVVFVGALACVAARLMMGGDAPAWLRRTAGASALAFGLVFTSGALLVQRGIHPLPIMWAKGALQDPFAYETWNSFSRIAVSGPMVQRPRGWGISTVYPEAARVKQMWMNIDAAAGTPILPLEPDRAAVEHLKYDVTNAAHFFRTGGDAMVIGVGGGRDVLSALVFGQKSVTGVELNGDILDAINRVYGDFVGHIDRDPRVRFVNDEARSWIERTHQKFDLIEMSLIDTWAATAAGAFVLSENSLYTVEAWRSFLARLNPKGVLSVSRWYGDPMPGEIYRSLALAVASLRERGVTNVRDHILLVRHMIPAAGASPSAGVGNLMISVDPFTPGDVRKLEAECVKLKFEVMLSPQVSRDPVLSDMCAAPDLSKFVEPFPIDISPPTDDAPFFFQMLRPRQLFDAAQRGRAGLKFNVHSVLVLSTLFLVVSGLALVLIALPWLASVAGAAARPRLPWAPVIYFGAIGYAFMFVEISQMQRLVVFLGHPTYSLTVVLFVLLVAGGAGSFLVGRVRPERVVPVLRARLKVLLVTLIGIGFLTGPITHVLAGAVTPMRIAASAGLLFPMGLLMGMCFPLGMRAMAARPDATAWLWGVNGATSICGSVHATVVALMLGISAAHWTGTLAYALAWWAAGKFELERRG